jgi:hypothetical protein
MIAASKDIPLQAFSICQKPAYNYSLYNNEQFQPTEEVTVCTVRNASSTSNSGTLSYFFCKC